MRELADTFPLQVTLQPITGPMYANAINNLFVKVTNRGKVMVKLFEVEVHGVFTEPEMEERIPLRTDDGLEMDLFGNVPQAPVLRPGASVVIPLKVPCLIPEGWAGLEPGTQTTSPALVRAVVKVQEGLPDIFDTPRPVYRAASAWTDIALAGTIPPQPAR